MNDKVISMIVMNIISRRFEDLNEEERREYLREHPESRWNPGKARRPRRKLRKRR
jgi:hypothetical protein